MTTPLARLRRRLGRWAYEIRDAETGETLNVLDDDLPRARSAFVHGAAEFGRPVVLVGPDGEIVMSAKATRRHAAD